MKRREALKGLSLAATAALASGPSLFANSYAQGSGKPGAPPSGGILGSGKKGIGLVDIAPVDPNYFIPNRFKGKTLIITGCARGMGQAAAMRAAKEGANIVGVDWIKDLGQSVINDIVKAGGKAEFVYGDVGETETCDRMVDVAVKKFGGLDLALNNAGVMDGVFSGDPINYEKQKNLIFKPIHEASDEYWDKVVRTNATGVFKSMRAELRQLVKQMRGGAIVNVGSVTAIIGFGGNCAYSASKHAVSALTRAAAIDYSVYGIRVNSVNMAATDTPMVERAKKLVAASMREKGGAPSVSLLKTESLLSATDSATRAATPQEQVAVMLFLLSEEASNLTGALYATDGGYSTY